MSDIQRHLDIGSRIIILVTLVLFVAALFFKGFGHDLLLEAGVFLVSVKLIMMAYKNSVAARQLNDRFDGVQTTLARIENILEARRPRQLPMGPNKALQPPGAEDCSDEANGRDRARG